MSAPTLPPLPEPQKVCWIGHELFSADQLRERDRAIVEFCAKVCSMLEASYTDDGARLAAYECAAALRKLLENAE